MWGCRLCDEDMLKEGGRGGRGSSAPAAAREARTRLHPVRAPLSVLQALHGLPLGHPVARERGEVITLGHIMVVASPLSAHSPKQPYN